MSAREEFDLLARARRQPLASSEERELSELLREDVAARCLLEAGLEADREAASASDDAAWITRLARTAELSALGDHGARPQRRPRSRASRVGRTLRATPVLAATICFACGALAGVGAIAVHDALRSNPAARTPAPARNREPSKVPERSSQRSAAVAPGPESSTHASSSNALVPSGSTHVVPPPNAIPLTNTAPPPPTLRRAEPSRPEVVDAEPPPALRHAGSASAPPIASRPSADDPAELYRRGNRARQEGRTAEAIETYRELQVAHPASREAVASHLTLGNLFLLQGDAEKALGQFRAHRAAGGAGFERDSLWGEATALRKLGRLSEEREVLTVLVTRYPDSAYELAARRRLRTSN